MIIFSYYFKPVGGAKKNISQKGRETFTTSPPLVPKKKKKKIKRMSQKKNKK